MEGVVKCDKFPVKRQVSMRSNYGMTNGCGLNSLHKLRHGHKLAGPSRPGYCLSKSLCCRAAQRAVSIIVLQNQAAIGVNLRLIV